MVSNDERETMRRYSLYLLLLIPLLACTFLPRGFGQQPAPTAAPQATSAIERPTAQSEQDTEEAQATDTPEATPENEQTSAVFEEGECLFVIPDGTKPICGDLSVPEDRSDPNSRTIKLHVAVFKATGHRPQPDPVVYLEGGPGGNPLETISFVFDDWFGQIVRSRDVIIFDQRGTGLSDPALDCYELSDLSYSLLDTDLTKEEYLAQSLPVVKQCRDRFTAEGVNLAAYNSAANAADLNDLRIALGYQEWNLYGISYGTRLALTAMRDWPTGIRSVILDSVYPPQAKETELAANADRAFNELFQACAQDKRCNDNFPNLKEAFYETVNRLEAEPAMLKTIDPFTGQFYDVSWDGEAMVSTLFQILYQTSRLPDIPKLIYDAYRDQDYSDWVYEGTFSIFAHEFMSDGMYYSVQCNEEVSFNTREDLENSDLKYPEQLDVFGDSSLLEACAIWDSGKADPIENEPVVSDIPALVMAGQFDPVTPPSYAEEAAKTLSHSYYLEFPGMGHGVSVDGGCPQGIVQEFLNDPSKQPNSRCIARMNKLSFSR
jgi:pimeloyl-ACP methyl ester carboxylesterase